MIIDCWIDWLVNWVFVQWGVQELLGAAHKLVGHYKHSTVSFQTLKQMQAQLGMPQHTLLRDVSTRWNSSFYMLQRLIEQRTALLASSAASACMIELRARQWNLAEKLVHLLQPFEEATREVSGDCSSAALITAIGNSNDFLPLLQNLLQMTIWYQSMKREMLASLSRRYHNIETTQLYTQATQPLTYDSSNCCCQYWQLCLANIFLYSHPQCHQNAFLARRVKLWVTEETDLVQKT